MIDLHIHTTCSDGDYSPTEILKMCEDIGLEYISVTDHMSSSAYIEIDNNRDTFSGKIIVGSEIQSQFDNIHIEVLCYGFNYHKMIKWIDNNYSKGIMYKQKEKELRLGLKACEKLGLKIDKEDFLNFDDTLYSSQIILNSVCKYDENIDKFPKDAWKNIGVFYRKYQSNPKSIWYFGERDIFPSLDKIIELIHDDNGLVFFAHPFEYKISDMAEFLNKLFTKYKIDGIECYHSTFSNEQINFLLEYCKANNLLMCGGSDYHGPKIKPDISLGIGRGNLNISTSIIEPWISKIKTI